MTVLDLQASVPHTVTQMGSDAIPDHAPEPHGRGVRREGVTMPAAMLTRDQLAAAITAARVEQQAHDRCGDKAKCRQEATDDLDRLLDLWAVS